MVFKPLPLYVFNQPKLENVKIPRAACYENIKYPQWLLPRSFVELFLIPTIGVFTYNMKRWPVIGIGPHKIGIQSNGIVRFVATLYTSFFICRTANYYLERNYERNKVICEDYIKLHPEKFPHYEVKKMIDTFDSWTPVRTGGRMWTWTRSEEAQVMRKPDPDHYIPVQDQQKSS